MLEGVKVLVTVPDARRHGLLARSFGKLEVGVVRKAKGDDLEIFDGGGTAVGRAELHLDHLRSRGAGDVAEMLPRTRGVRDGVLDIAKPTEISIEDVPRFDRLGARGRSHQPGADEDNPNL